MIAAQPTINRTLFLNNIVRCLTLFAVLVLVSSGYFFDTSLSGIVITSITLFLYTTLTVYTFKRLSNQSTIPESQFFLHLAGDIIALTVLFIFSGSSANPFVSFYLFPIIVSASVLESKYTWCLLSLGIGGYSSLFAIDMFWPASNTSMPVDHNMLGHDMSSHAVGSSENTPFSLHLYGMWFTFAFSALLIATFVVRMRKQLTRQQQKINSQRETALRDEQVIAIATQAANVAHHIGTPLSTISVIANDLIQEPALQDFKYELNILSSQVELCRNELQQLRVDTDKSNQQLSCHILLRQLLNNIKNELTLLHPQTVINLHYSSIEERAGIKADQGLKLAILSLLNNACEASPEKIDITVEQQQSQAMIRIRDYGGGIPQTLEGDMRQPTESTKSSGLGLGLFLSHATVERQGGIVRLSNIAEDNTDTPSDNSGTLTEITLPLNSDNAN